MRSSGSSDAPPGPPLWLLAELTYRCPLQCPYCSNPLDFAQQGAELSTDEWIRVFAEARAMGAAQLGFSGGEPLVRQDLAELIKAARDMGYYQPDHLGDRPDRRQDRRIQGGRARSHPDQLSGRRRNGQ